MPPDPQARPRHSQPGPGTSSTKRLTRAALELYDRIVDPGLLVRRLSLTANRVVEESAARKVEPAEQLDLFTDYEALQAKQAQEELERARRMQAAVLSVKQKFGKNAILKGMNLEDGAIAQDRNR